MAVLIYGGRLRVSECCQLRVKDIDFDQGLVFVRGGTRRGVLLTSSEPAWAGNPNNACVGIPAGRRA